MDIIFYLKIKTGQWVVDPTKYWVTRKSRYGGPRDCAYYTQRCPNEKLGALCEGQTTMEQLDN
jgi:hypothetical protein